MATVEFGTGKTVFILTIVVACFAVLWPKIFYPMLQASITVQQTPPAENTQVCCDVIFETDVNAIKIMTEMCSNILGRRDNLDPRFIQSFQEGKLSKEVVELCRNEVLNTCGIDITAVIREKTRLNKPYRQILDEIRSFNNSICLKQNYGIEPGTLGAPRRMRVRVETPKHIRPERPPHVRSELLHPALQEKGRAIPQRKIEVEGRPGPIPGMRPPMGGAGHVVPAPKGSGTMGIVMPLYTVGIVIFFVYTIMKVLFKKHEDRTPKYKDFGMDPEFRKMVFSEDYKGRPYTYEDNMQQREKKETVSRPARKSNDEVPSKLGDIEIDQLRRRLEETEAAMERIVAQMGSVSDKLTSSSQAADVLAESKVARGVKSEENATRESWLDTSGSPDEQADIPRKQTQQVDQSHTSKSVGSSVGSEASQHSRGVRFSGLTSEQDVSDGEDASETSEPVTAATDLDDNEINSAVPEIEVDGTRGLGKGKDLVEISKQKPAGRGEDSQVKVVGMETTARCEGGQRWSRPTTPVGGSRSHSTTPVPPLEAQSIFLEGALPSQSQLLVSESECEAHTMSRDQLELDESEYDSAPVILSGKMTLSVISLDEGKLESTAASLVSVTDEDRQLSRVGRDPVLDSALDETQKLQELESALREEPILRTSSPIPRQDTQESGVQGHEPRSDRRVLDGTKKQSFEYMNAHDDEAVNTNYTTASGAAEATNTTGTEETSADVSAMESFGDIDDQDDRDLLPPEELPDDHHPGIHNGIEVLNGTYSDGLNVDSSHDKHLHRD